ncbi:MAG TPA: hypothetical protein VHS58_05700, partial [Acetobacteraceae bacterium]|nr:hypothetical protein [Acetobacteraceae bacterium]
MLDRISIRARLIGLAVILLGITIGTDLYLTRALDSASAAAVQSDRLVQEIKHASAVRVAFDDLRYWMTDLAVSLLTQSERNAETARLRLQARLEEFTQDEPELATTIRTEARAFDDAAGKAVDAYTNDQRVLGNSLFAGAREHGQRVDALLDKLDVQLLQRINASRDRIIARTEATARVASGV